MFSKRISKNFLLLFSGNFISQAIMFFSLVLIANVLSPTQFGRFAFAQSIIVFMTRCVEFGADTVAIRKIAQNSDSHNLIPAIFSLRFVFTSIIVICSSVFVVLYFNDISDKELFLILLISLFGVSFTLEWFYQAHEKMHIVGVVRLLRSLIFITPIIFFLNNNLTETSIAWFYSLSFVATSVIFLIYFFQSNSLPVWENAFNNMKNVFNESAPIGVSNLLFQIPFTFSTFIIGLMLTSADVGFFSVAFRPAIAVWSFGIIAAYNAFFPVMSSIGQDSSKLPSFIYKLSGVLNGASIFLFLSLAPLAHFIIGTLYSDKYPGSEYIFQYTLLIVSIVLSRAAVEYSLLAMNKRSQYLIGAIIVSSSYILFCTFGVFLGGIAGVLSGSILSEIIYTIYVFKIFHFSEIRKNLLVHLFKFAGITSLLYLLFLLGGSIPFILRYIILLGSSLVAIHVTKLFSFKLLVRLGQTQ